ncbi:MAG TPA: D-alanyl-D-alanine carboxypeptidase/D-alanyl-D-alanine-endopeptidase [Gemmatimonas sp.]|nr:D-alanyl-D-alanine carboxypeptidase/D-alanyl-D-alanine-endopeptidase [Gemmatimonas sp.]
MPRTAEVRVGARVGRRIGVLAMAVLATAIPGCRTASSVASPSPSPSGTIAPPETRRSEPVAPVMLPPAIVSEPARTRDRDRIRALADSALRAPMWNVARWGVLVVDATDGDTLFSHDADKLFMPASNQKLLTAAIALQHLGPDYVWRTPVLLRGRQRGSTWDGDVLIVGSGDPTFSDSLRSGEAASAFDPIVAALAARGISRITGAVHAFGDAFAGATTGFGWEIDDLDSSYGAPVDELTFNEGEFQLRARAGSRAGAAVVLSKSTTSGYPRVVNTATTRAADQGGEPFRAVYDSIGDAILLTGTIAVGDSASFSMAYRHPADAVVAEVTSRLVSRGIKVSNRSAGRGASAQPASLDTLVVLVSPPLSAVLPRMQKPSQNQIAELLFRTTGLHVTGIGSADSARAVAARTLAALGVRNDGVAYRDGSGMSRHDYVTPRALVQILDAMRGSATFDLFRNALPLAGVDGTLRNRMRGTPAAGNAQAKTGTVDKARSLSGYVRSADGRLVMYALLCNNFVVPTREVERVQDLLVVAIAGARLADRAPASGR